MTASLSITAPAPLNLLCARFWPDRHGGVEQRLFHVAKALAAQGRPTQVLTENRTGAAAHEQLHQHLTIRRFAPLDAGRLWRWRAPLRVQWWRRVIANHATTGPIWATDAAMAAAALLAGRGRDLIYNPAGCVAAMRRVGRAYPFARTLRLSAAVQWLDGWACRRAARVVVSSQNVAQQYAQAYGARDDIVIVPHGVELPPVMSRRHARQTLGLPENAWIIGFVGRLDPCKDLGFLLEAAAMSLTNGNERLLLVGDGPDRARADRLAAEHGLSNRILWAGGTDDPRPYYAAMDVMVLPSVYEAFGNVILEAMAAGVPVLGRRRDDSGGQPVLTACDELIRHGQTGLLFDAHDPADLAQQLADLRALPARRSAMGRRAAAFASTMSWQRTIQQYLEVVLREKAVEPSTEHAARRRAAA